MSFITGYSLPAPGSSGNLLVSNGSQWISSAPAASGLNLLSTITTTGSTTVDVETGFSSTYNDYLIVADGWKMSAAIATPRIELKIGGTYLTSNYFWNTNYAQANAVPGDFVGESSGGGIDGWIQALPSSLGISGATNSANMNFWVFDVNNTTQYKHVFYDGTVAHSGGFSRVVGGARGGTSTGVLSGVRFQWSTGNTIGTFKLYGLSK